MKELIIQITDLQQAGTTISEMVKQIMEENGLKPIMPNWTTALQGLAEKREGYDSVCAYIQAKGGSVTFMAYQSSEFNSNTQRMADCTDASLRSGIEWLAK